jgi:hypothetical protein
MRSAPCGESGGIPTSFSTGWIGHDADLSRVDRWLLPATGRSAFPFSGCLRPERRSFRLDDPPECTDVA